MADVYGNVKPNSSAVPAVKNDKSEQSATTGPSDKDRPAILKPVDGKPLVKHEGHGGDSKEMEEGLLSDSREKKEKKRQRTCCCVCMWICGVQIAIIVLLGLLVLILYLVYKPKGPEVSLDAEKGRPFVTSYYEVEDNTTITNATKLFLKMLQRKDAFMNITGQIDYTVTIRNPNKFDLFSEGCNLVVTFEKTTFVTSVIDPFKVHSSSIRSVQSSAIFDLQITSPMALQFLAAALGGEITFNTVFTQAAKIKILGIVSPKVTIAVQCDLTFTVEDKKLKNKICRVQSLKIG